MRAFKVSYDDSIVKFYDSRSREIKTSIVNVQKCTTDQADISKGINAFKLKDGFTLVTDAKHLGGKDQGRYYRMVRKSIRSFERRPNDEFNLEHGLSSMGQ